MNEFLIYILKSTACLTILFLVFRLLMSREAFFSMNRLILLMILVISSIIPVIILPQNGTAISYQELVPVRINTKTISEVINSDTERITISTPGVQINSLLIIYLCGMAVSVLPVSQKDFL